jgi:hypothetical protein
MEQVDELFGKFLAFKQESLVAASTLRSYYKLFKIITSALRQKDQRLSST